MTSEFANNFEVKKSKQIIIYFIIIEPCLFQLNILNFIILNINKGIIL